MQSHWHEIRHTWSMFFSPPWRRCATSWKCRTDLQPDPHHDCSRHLLLKESLDQTCAKVPKRFEILGSLSPRSGTLMDLGPCTSFLPWDSGNPGPQNCVMPQDPGNPGPQDFDMQWDPENQGPQNFDSRKTLETQDLKIWICGETLETQDPEPQNFDVSRLKRPWSLHHSIQNFMLSIVPGSSTGDELGRSDSKT